MLCPQFHPSFSLVAVTLFPSIRFNQTLVLVIILSITFVAKTPSLSQTHKCLHPNLPPTAYIPVPSMLPRPLLTSTFALTYRKIPVLAIGRDIYCDTSIIIEALEHFFPVSQGWGTVYPKCEGLGGWTYRGLVRGFASFWTDVSGLQHAFCFRFIK
jgi:hypothetical protein